MHDLVLVGGSVLTDAGLRTTDVAVTDGRVTAIGRELGESREIVECSGAWVGPGFVDLHTHLRDPGHEWREDIGSGSAAAAAGGYTALVAMPNTDPPIDAGHLALRISDEARRVGKVAVVSAGCLTMGRGGERMAHLDDLWSAGVRLFTDDGDSLQNVAVLRSVMEYVAQLGGVVSQHALDADLSGAGFMHEGSVSSRLGIYGIPRQADDIVIARDIAIMRMTGVRYHVQHLSTAGGVALVAAAKAEGLPITAEVTPHHLMFDHTAVMSTDSNFKMMPPLREESDREALVEGLRSGVIDAVATDHAPQSAVEKDVPFEHALNGVIGLEWAASVVNGVVSLDQDVFFDRMSITPAAIAGFTDHGRAVAVGAEANLVVFDPNVRWTPTSTRSRSRNAPYLGRELTGRVEVTILGGAITYGGEL
ncbi:MAG: dihydroorotase [Actinomycetota bacterium]|nr:dihydroorotase [Actinomycetota bacterium]